MGKFTGNLFDVFFCIHFIQHNPIPYSFWWLFQVFEKCGDNFYSGLIQFFLFFVPTFDTKVTEYLCSGGFFFLQTNFDFLTSHFWRNFFISFERYCCPELKFEKIFYLWLFFVKLRGFKDCNFGQFGKINARYFALLTRKRRVNPS